MSTMARQTLEMTCYYALTGSVVLFKPTANAVTHNNASQPEHHTRSSVHMSDCKAHKRLYNRKQCAQSIPCVCVCDFGQQYTWCKALGTQWIASCTCSAAAYHHNIV